MPPKATRLTVLSANLYHGRADAVALLAIVDRLKPDLLNLQELNRGFAVKLRRLGVGRRFPQSVVSIQRGVTGAGIFSRYPLTALPRSRFGPRMLRAEIEVPGGGRVKVTDVHPSRPRGVALGPGLKNSAPYPRLATVFLGCSSAISTPRSTMPSFAMSAVVAIAMPATSQARV